MVQKYAVVAGCDYPNTGSELRGCRNDAFSIFELLTMKMGFNRTNVNCMVDNPGCMVPPTASNIKAALNRFFSIARYGDVVLLYFAGHGTTIPGYHSSTGRDEQAILASDFNMITSIDFRKILNGTPYGVRFIIISDSCHSGGLIDKEQEQIGPQHPPMNVSQGFRAGGQTRRIPFEVVLQQLSLQAHNHVPTQFVRMFGSEASLVFCSNIPHGPRLQPDQGILFSGCQSNESSGETTFVGEWHGVFTGGVLHALQMFPDGVITNRDLVIRARRFVKSEGFQSQHPCLYCSDTNANALFLYLFG